MALINLDLHYITFFRQLKFGRVFVSVWAGIRPSNLATLFVMRSARI